MIEIADRRFLKFSYSFSRHRCFYDYQKTNAKFWVLACCGVHWSRRVDCRCCSFLRLSTFCILKLMDTIPNHTDSCLKARSRSEDRYIAILGKRTRRAASPGMTSMLTASNDKAIFTAAVRRRLHISGLYARVPPNCVFLSVQSRRGRLKWCREHVIWTVSD